LYVNAYIDISTETYVVNWTVVTVFIPITHLFTTIGFSESGSRSGSS